ncbi:MAG: nitrogenase-stabilizing/protective protein NifW [Halothiobacillaceae bacterium]|jgi:nitrogenase-stabilizing/protective protein|nr:nitrogenase-stabilizing/protective protein NifW [Halothiobacillaceae bacterium]
MNRHELEENLEELSSAEDFLDFFGVSYNPGVVQVNRLHILQRFHDYLNRRGAPLPEDGTARFAAYRAHLEQAYQDFVASDALTEKVFKVFHMHGPQTTFVALGDLFKR